MSKPENSEAINGKKYRIFPGQSDPLLEHDMFSRTFMPKDTSYNEYDTTDEVVKAIVDNSKFDIPTLPAIGTPIVIGELYTDDGKVYRVRQSHSVTHYDPDDIPALFTVYRVETEEDMTWIDSEQVDKGTIRTYDGQSYECIQSHQTQSDWTPNVTPSLWKIYVESVEGEWIVGVTYAIDDPVTYNEIDYVCIQSHTAQLGWEPGTATSLWSLAKEPVVVLSNWEQPGSTNPYMLGDQVLFNGDTWESIVNNNVWSPGVYGWVEIT